MNIATYFKGRKIVGGGLQFQTVRRFLFAKGIKTSYEPYLNEKHSAEECDYDDPDAVTRDDSDKRMIFSLTGDANKGANAYAHGLILNRKTWECVVMPPPYFEVNPVANVVEQHLADKLYDIIPARDGSVMNLYWWNNEWRISTTKGYDMTDTPFLHLPKTFKQIFVEAAGQSWDEFTSVLNREFCYSFVVTHSDIHLYWKTKKPDRQICFIQRAARVTGTIDYTCEHKMNSQEAVPIQATTLNELRNLPSDQFPFGVILKSKDFTRTRAMSYVFLESRLFIDLKTLVYNYWINREIDETVNRENYIVLRAYLSKYHHTRFRELFPQYEIMFDEISEKISQLINAICVLYTNKQGGDTILWRTAKQIRSYIDKMVTVTKDKQKIIQSYILQPDMTKSLYQFIFAA